MKAIFLLFFTAIFSFAWVSQENPYYQHKKSQFDLLSKSDKYEIMMLGDSITDQGLWNELLQSNTIQNRGISGDNTAGVLDRLNSINKSIKKVFIMIGVNDIMGAENLDVIYSNYLKIIDVFQNRDIKVYIQSTLYTGGQRAQKFNKTIEELNKKLVQYATENKITYIDLNKYFVSNKELKKEFSYDELHLNGKAYKIWADEIKPFIEK